MPTPPPPRRTPDDLAARPADRPRRPPPVRRTMRYTTVLGVSIAAFGLWLLLDAPTLQRNAQSQPVGVRRTVALDTLGPLALFSRGFQLSHVVSLANGALGRTGNTPGAGAPAPPGGPTAPLGHLPHG